MSDDPPEVQAVLDAAVGWHLALAEDDVTEAALLAAVAAYRKATAPPEPFEGFIYRWSNGEWDDALYADDPGGDVVNLWRCTVTPIERVR